MYILEIKSCKNYLTTTTNTHSSSKATKHTQPIKENPCQKKLVFNRNFGAKHFFL